MPVKNDRRLFEKLCLESFQSGLSWRTILHKRENFRAAFDGFDYRKMARYGARDVKRLLGDAGIVRHRGKIEAVLANAKRACELEDAGESLSSIVWQHEPTPAERPKRLTHAAAMKLTETEASRALAKRLKQAGWRFFGPTTAYAFLQSMGVVNDHLEGCFRREEVSALRQKFRRPR